MNLETSKNLGGVGAILMFVSVLLTYASVFSGILSLVGLILVLLALKGLADHYNDAGVFNNALYTVILVIIGFVVAVALIFVAAFGLLADLGLDMANLAAWSGGEFAGEFAGEFLALNIGFIGEFFAQVVLAAVVLWICLIIGAVLLRRSLGTVSAKSGVGLFGTTGLLMLIGAAIPVFGLILMWIGLLLLAVAFFQIRPQSAT